MGWLGDEEDEQGGKGSSGEQCFTCPYCWEQVCPPLEADLYGELVWDCEVCCRPWLITIVVHIDGSREVSVERAQN